MRDFEAQATTFKSGTLMRHKSVQVIFNKNRQNIWRDGNACRFGIITGSRRLQP
jgi:hypothetical protein